MNCNEIKGSDNVNHPGHYEQACSIECIDAMELAFGPEAVLYFSLCNAFKYTWRWKYKNGAEDLEKAKWYLKKAEDLTEENALPAECYVLFLRTEKLLRTVVDKRDGTNNGH